MAGWEAGRIYEIVYRAKDPVVVGDTRPMPAIPGVAIARAPYQPHRLSLGAGWGRGVVDREPPAVGEPYTVLVPRADSLGNELGGIQSVELRVPVATYLPWQLRAAAPTDRLVSFQGTFVPLPRTEADRVRSGDGRPSLERLYRSRQDFLTAVERATAALVAQRFMLPSDRMVAQDRMASTYDWVLSR